jgi:DNA-binding transcriptional regulator YiaG
MTTVLEITVVSISVQARKQRLDGALRNWEQGRREPTGPAKALLAAIERDPENVLKALAA